MNTLNKYIDFLLKTIVSIIVVVMVTAVFTNALLRYFFNSGLMWSEELARYSFVWLIFLGAIMAYKDREHIIVDTVVRILNVKIQKILYFLSNLLVLVTMFIFIHGLVMLIEMNRGIIGPATGIPINILYYGGLVSAIGIILLTIYQTTRGAQNKDLPEWIESKVSPNGNTSKGDDTL